MLLFPPRQDAEASLRAYIEETSDIPLPWLVEGLRGFKDEGERIFLPSISEVRASVAKHYVAAGRKILLRDSHDSVAQKPIDVGRMIERMGTEAPLGYAQLQAVLEPKRKRLTIEASNREALEADDATPHQQRSEMTRVTLDYIEGLIEADGLTPQLARRQRERERRERMGVK